MKLLKWFSLTNLLIIILLTSPFQSSLLNMSSLLSFKNSAAFTEMMAKKHRAKVATSTQGPIIHQGWVKYFHYSNTQLKKPKTFFKNPNFAEDSKRKEIPAPDKYGPMNIPSEKHFFGVIYEDDMDFFLSRERARTYLYDSIHIDFIKAIPDNHKQHGGIRKLGKFLEGYCIEIFTIIPNKQFTMTKEHVNPESGIEQTWLVCADTEEAVDKIMDTLIGLKLKKQHKLGVHLSAESEHPDEIPTPKPIDDDINPPDLGPNDGYWIILQDWTNCTLKCGGGKQVRQLSCVPPKLNGKECQGTAIRERPCNTQPCPKPEKLSEIIDKDKQLPTTNQFLQGLNSPVVRVMPISNKPQRYDKCHIKDTDALMVIYQIGDTVIEKGAKVPIRLVMNNKSIMAFQDEKLESAYSSYLLDETKFFLDESDKNCFILGSLNKKDKFCQLETAGKKGFVEEWNYDFHLFKDKCRQERPTIDALNEIDPNEDPTSINFIAKKRMKLKEVSKKDDEYLLRKKIEETKALTLAAVMKESKLEEMLIKEEEERQRQELEEIKLQIIKEENKKKCMQNAIKEKELESQVILSQEKANSELEKIQKEAKQQIQIKRNMLKEKILKMRQMFNRQKQKYQNQIQIIRTETANDLQKLTKKGNMDLCFLHDKENKDHTDKVEKYCASHFILDNASFVDCQQNYCQACCENEFGEAHQVERRKCLSVKCNIDY